MRCASLLVLGVLVGCEGLPGDYPAAHGEIEYVSEGDTFSVRFLAPPWVLTREDPDAVEMEISNEVFGVPLEGSPPTHVFRMVHADAPEGLQGLVPRKDPPPAGDKLPRHLRGIDLTYVPDVAFAELNHLIDTEDAQLDREIEVFVTDAGTQGLVFQVIVEPGLFIRGFYFEAAPTVVRAMFVSLFDLRTPDVDLMAGSIET